MLVSTFLVQIDKELASGEYFLKESQKKRKRVEEIKVKLLQPVIQLKPEIKHFLISVPFALLCTDTWLFLSLTLGKASRSSQEKTRRKK